jgi:hypothetical protein
MGILLNRDKKTFQVGFLRIVNVNQGAGLLDLLNSYTIEAKKRVVNW